jgi:hypothetical protein
MHADEIVLRRFELRIGAATGNQPIPLVIHVQQKFGVLIEQRTADSQHRSLLWSLAEESNSSGHKPTADDSKTDAQQNWEFCIRKE